MWLRALAMAFVLLAWVAVRRATRRPIRHAWLVAILLGGASALLSALVDRQDDGGAAQVAFTCSAMVGFGCVFALGEGLRREVGLTGSGPRRIAALAVISAAAALVCGALPPPRDRIVADIAGAAILLNLLGPLFAAPQRIGSWLLGAGIVGYALVRSVLVVTQLRGGDVVALEHVLDTAVIVLLGAGIVVFVLESAFPRKTTRTR